MAGSKGRRGNGEGSIYQREDGVWTASVSLGFRGTRRLRKTLYGRTRAEVRDKLTRALRDVQQALPLPADRQTVGGFLELWLNDVARHTVRPSTWESYARILRLHVIPDLGRKGLSKLTPQDLARLYSLLLQKGLSPRTAQLAHAVIHRALEQAVRWNQLGRNPADQVDAPRPRRQPIEPLTADQATRFLDAAQPDRLEALYVLAVTTGMRQGELLGLRWADVEWTVGTVQIRQQVGRVKGGMAFMEPKTAKSRRTVALPTLAVEALRRHRNRQLEERLLAGSLWQDHDLVFASRVGSPVERQNLMRRSFWPILDRAELRRIRFHDLRHTAATLLLTQGIHPKVVQERLGHATISVTMDVYSHVMPNLQQEAAQKLDKLFSPKLQASTEA